MPHLPFVCHAGQQQQQGLAPVNVGAAGSPSVETGTGSVSVERALCDAVHVLSGQGCLLNLVASEKGGKSLRASMGALPSPASQPGCSAARQKRGSIPY